ncbi:MAG: MFS transporter [Proteobacteria bacterium]|nr:MFS transporter [Pseudomonadota bacterium]
MPAERDLTAAIDEAGIRGRFVLVFGLIALLLVCELFDYFVVGYLVSAIAPAWGLTFGKTSIMLLSAGVGAIVGALAGGRLADRYGRKHVLLGAATVVCVGAGAIGFVPDGDWISFTLMRFIIGIGYGACGSSQFALIAEYTPRARRTLLTSSMGIPAGVGLLLASSVVSILYAQLGWRGTALLGFVPLAVVALIAWIAPESPRWLLSRGRSEEAQRAASSMLRLPAYNPVAQAPAPSAASVSLREVWADGRRFWLIVVIQVALGSVLAGVLLWGPTLVAQVFEVSPQRAATYFVGVSLSALAGRVAFTWLPHRIGRVKSGLLVGFGGATALLLAVWQHDAYWAGVPVLFLCLVAGQFFYDGGFSNLTTYAAELYPVRAGARAMGVSAGSAGIGKILGPLAMGLIAGADNLVSPAVTQQAVVPVFLFLAACCLVVGLAYAFLGVETAHQPQRLA